MDPEPHEHPVLRPVRARNLDFDDVGSTPVPLEVTMEVLYAKCAGLDVHRDTVVACVRIAADGSVHQEVRTFGTTTTELLALSDWLSEHGVTRVAMEATGVY